ncbi:MAG: flavin reductase [Firmicutes bacterium]|nr:flavin reductase [Bacillota bacterium]
MSKIALKGSAMLNPVPAVLITSRKDGFVNVFTAAWVGTICTKPPMVSVSIRPERLSYEMIKSTGQFTINLPGSKLVRALDFCGVRSGRDVDKIEKFNLTLEDGIQIDAPSIAECPVALECSVTEILPLGSHHMFIAEVVQVKVEETLVDGNGRIRFDKADLVCYSHGEYFPLKNVPLGKFGYSVQKKKSKGRIK